MNKTILDSVFQPSRRTFLRGTAAASALALTPRADTLAEDAPGNLPAAFAGLKPLGSRVHPIQADEFHERLMHAQKLMSAPGSKYDALFFAPGSFLYYFTGIRWGMSERLL